MSEAIPPFLTKPATLLVAGGAQTNHHDGLIMSTTEETHQCEIELELSKHDFHQDLSQIGQKLHETRVRLSPTHVIGENSLLVSALGLLVGAILGYRNLPSRDTDKPLVRTMLTRVGKQIAARTIGG